MTRDNIPVAMGNQHMLTERCITQKERLFCYRPQRSWAKVIFLQASVCPQGGRGVCLSACWDIPPGPGRPPKTRPPPGADTPQTRQTPPEQTPPGPGRYPGSRHPPDQADPPRADTPLKQTSPATRQTPPREADFSIRSTRGRYASYWNAFLF